MPFIDVSIIDHQHLLKETADHMLMDVDPQSALLSYSAPAIEITTLAKPLWKDNTCFFSQMNTSVGR